MAENGYDVGTLVAEMQVDVSGIQEGMQKAGVELEKLNSKIQNIEQALKEQTSSVTKAMENMSNGIAGVTDKIGRMQASITTNFQHLKNHITSTSQESVNAINGLTNVVSSSSGTISSQLGTISGAVGKLNENFGLLVREIIPGIMQFAASNKVMGDSADTNVNRTINAFGKMRNAVKKSVEGLTTSLNQFDNSVKALSNNVGVIATSITTSFSGMGQRLDNIFAAIMMQTRVLGATMSNLQKEVRKLQDDTGKMGSAGNSAFNNMGVGANGFLGKLRLMSLNFYILNYHLQNLKQLFDSVVGSAIRYSASLETTTLGVAGIITSMTRLNGETVKYETALGMSAGIMERIRDAALQTTVTTDELAKSFMSALGPGLNAGMNIEQVLKLTTVATNAVKSFGLNSNQVIQEIRGLISGDAIRPGVDMLATALGYTTATVNQLRAEGKLYEDIMKRMEGFSRVVKDQADTWDGLTSNLKDGWLRVMGEAVEPLFVLLKSELREVTALFYTLEDTADGGFKAVINEGTQNAIKESIRFLSLLWDATYKLGKSLGDVLTPAFKLLMGTLAALAEIVVVVFRALEIFFTQLSSVINVIIDGVSWLLNINDAFTQVGGSVNFLAIALGAVLIAMFPVKALFLVIAFLTGELIKNFGYLRTAFSNLASWGYNSMNVIAEVMVSVYYLARGLLSILTRNFDAAQRYFGMYESHQASAKDFANKATQSWDTMKDNIGRTVDNIIDDIKNLVDFSTASGKKIKPIGTDGLTPAYPAGDKNRKAAQLAIAQIDADTKKLLEALKLRQKKLDEEYAHGLLAITEYYDQTADIQRQLINIQIDAWKAKEAVYVEERDKEKARGEQEKLKIQLKESDIKVSNDQIKAYKELANEVFKLDNDYAKLVNNLKAGLDKDVMSAYSADMIKSYTNRLWMEKQLQLAQKGDIELTDERKKSYAEWISTLKGYESQVKTIVGTKYIEMEINRDLNALDSKSLDFDVKRQKIERELADSLITDEQAKLKIFETEKQKLNELESSYINLIAKYEKMFEITSDPRWKQAAIGLRTELNNLSSTLDPVAKKFRDVFEDGLAKALEDIIMKVSSVGDAFRELGRAILGEMAKIVAKNLAKGIMNGIAPGLYGSTDKDISKEVEEAKKLLDGRVTGYVDAFSNSVSKVNTQIGTLLIPAFDRLIAKINETTGFNQLGEYPELGKGKNKEGGLTPNAEGANLDPKKQKSVAEKVINSQQEQVKGQQKVNAQLEQAGITKLPMFLGALGAVTGNKGLMKFAAQLQLVMMVMKMIEGLKAGKGILGAFGLANGGLVGGSGSDTSDNIPAMLSPGEYVLRAEAVRKIGRSALDKMNFGKGIMPANRNLPSLRMASGGYVGNSKGSTSMSQVNNITFAPQFQSIDPAEGQKMFEKQFPMYKAKMLDAIKNEPGARNIIKGAVK